MKVEESIEQLGQRKREFENLFNTKSMDYLNDPYRYYAEVRKRAPIYKTPYGIYLLTKHKDIQYALSHKGFIKNYWKPLREIYGEQCYQESGFSLISQWLINKNPPEHTKIRRLLVNALSAKKMSYVEQTSQIIADALIDEFFALGEIDLVKEYALKIPGLVICHLLGIPKEDQSFVLESMILPNVLLDPVYLSRKILDEANQSVEKLNAYFEKLCVNRKTKQGEDLLSLLLAAKEKEGIELSDGELISNIFFLFGAGHETTMNLISNGVFTLYKNPDELMKLKQDESLFSSAIHEILRYEAPVQIASPSFSIEEITINECVIPKNQVIMPILGAACRDPDEYLLPDQFSIERNPKNSLAFGYGIHLCLGAQLARIEGKVAIKSLLKRLPDLQIKNLNQPKWKPAISVRGLEILLAQW